MPDPETASSHPQLDLDKLEYPSDRITISHLRHLFPREFGSEYQGGFFEPSEHGELFGDMLHWERVLSARSFDRTLGRSQRNSITADEEIRAYLEGHYTTDFHIAQGPQHARQMIRDLEHAASEQARQYLRGQDR